MAFQRTRPPSPLVWCATASDLSSALPRARVGWQRAAVTIALTALLMGVLLVPYGAGAAPLGASGKLAFSSDRGGNSAAYAMSLDGTGVIDLTSNPAREASPAWAPDAAKIAFTSDRAGKDDIYVMNADGSDQVDLTNTPDDYDATPAWSPDGKKIAFSSDRAGG